MNTTDLTTKKICSDPDDAILFPKTPHNPKSNEAFDNIQLRNLERKLPQMNRMDHCETFLTLPTGKITIADIKSVQPFISRAEIRLLANL
ncbi:unnamed protein product [Orchesella dallaii]|uniref:Uncharacterized protein n=1 Tax=Orchesella dallaii TaxID=48710 RepID=A0ABP1RQ02_9HEXA